MLAQCFDGSMHVTRLIQFLLGAAILVGSNAFAKDIVVYQDITAEQAINTVVRATGSSPGLLTPVNWDDIVLEQPISIVGMGSVEVCGKHAVAEDVYARLSGIEDDVLYQRYAQARVEIEGAVRMLRCIDAPVDRRVSSRMHYLRAITLFDEGKLNQAREAFRSAFTFNDRLEWDENFDPAAKELFVQISGEVARDPGGQLHIRSHPGPGLLWLDGRPVPSHELDVRITAGDHVLQFGDPLRSALLMVPSGSANELIVPIASPDAGVHWLRDAKHGAEVTALFASVFGAGKRLYVITPDGVVWRGLAGDAIWAPYTVAAVANTSNTKRIVGKTPGTKRDRRTKAFAGLGGAIFAGGVTLAATSMVSVGVSQSQMRVALSSEEYANAESAATAAKSRVWIGAGISMIGGGLFGVGVMDRLSAAPLVFADGGGLTISLKK
jgi:hypothetical protein